MGGCVRGVVFFKVIVVRMFIWGGFLGDRRVKKILSWGGVSGVTGWGCVGCFVFWGAF